MSKGRMKAARGTVTSLLFFCVMFFSVAGIRAQQTCRSKAEVGEEAIQHPCNLLVPDDAFLVMGDKNTTRKMLTLVLMADTNCQNAAAAFLCANFWPQCYSQNHHSSNYRQRSACRSLCLTFFEACGSYLEQADGAAIPLPPCDFFPENATTVDGVEVPCLDHAFTSEQEKSLYPLLPCPPELVEKDGICVLPCPSPAFSDDEYDSLDAISTTFFLISLLATIFFLATSTGRAIAMKKSPLGQNAFWVVFSGFLLCLNSFWAIAMGWDNVRCESESSVNEPACTTYAFFFTYFALSCCFWLFLTILNMTLCVVLQKPEVHPRASIIYHVCGWIVPLIFPIILAAADKLGYDNSPWCQPTSDDPNDPEATLYWSFFLFFLPITLMAFATIVCNFVVIFWVWKWSKWEGLRAQWRMIMMGIGLCITYTFSLSFFYHRWNETEALGDAALDYLTCVLSRDGAPDTLCEMQNPFNFGVVVLTMISASSAGAVAVLWLGTRLGDFRFWWRGMSNLYHRRNFFDQRTVRLTSKSTYSSSRPTRGLSGAAEATSQDEEATEMSSQEE